MRRSSSRPRSAVAADRPSVSSLLALFAICLGMLGLLVSAEQVTSPTTDEHLHLTRGLAWWWGGDTRLNWPHPPLGQLVAAAPVALFSDPIDFSALNGFEEADKRSVALHYFERYEVARAHLSIARQTMIALAILLALYLFEWTRRRYGVRLALITTLLYAANPVLLAHAGLMTTDFPVTMVTIVALLQLHDYLTGRSWWSLIGLMLSIGALLTTKLSGIAVAVILLPPALLFAIAGRGRFAGLVGSRRASLLARDVVLTMLVGVLSINAVYRFDDTGLSSTEILERATPSTASKTEMTEDGLVARFWPDAWPMPLPFTYLYSVEFLKEQNARGHAGYFLGQPRPRPLTN